MLSDDRAAGRSTRHFILQQAHSTRDHSSLAAGKSGSTPSRDCHVRDQVPPDGEGGRLVAFKLREASACRAPGNDCRHESIYAAPSFSRPYGDESAAISKAASPACRAATHTHGWTGRGKCGVRRRIRKPEPIQSRVQAILWPTPNSRKDPAGVSHLEQCAQKLGDGCVGNWARSRAGSAHAHRSSSSWKPKIPYL